MKKNETDVDNKDEKNKNGEINASNIENAHASGDGSLGRDEETLILNQLKIKKMQLKKMPGNIDLNFEPQ